MLVYPQVEKQNYCIHLRILAFSRTSSHDSMNEMR